MAQQAPFGNAQQQQQQMQQIPPHMQVLAAKIEVESMSDFFSRCEALERRAHMRRPYGVPPRPLRSMSKSCFRKCVDKFKEGELATAEQACVDRCVLKYLAVQNQVSQKLANFNSPPSEHEAR
jgi:hypothetical protein